MNLYLIVAEDDNGESLDWFVWAHSAAQARQLWAQDRCDTGWDGEDADQPEDFLEHIRWVFEVPTTRPVMPRVLAWNSPDMVRYKQLNDIPDED